MIASVTKTLTPCFPSKGDCDKDEHCEGDLICFKRDGFEPVFGCEGDGDDGTDYCTEPYTLTPTTSKQVSYILCTLIVCDSFITLLLILLSTQLKLM